MSALTAFAHELLGMTLWKQKRTAEAMPHLLSSADIWSKIAAQEPKYTRAVLNVAEAYVDLKDWKNVALYADRAFKVGEDTKALSTRELARAAFMTGYSQQRLKQPTQAVRSLERSFQLYQQVTGELEQSMLVAGELYEAQKSAGQHCASQATLQTISSLASQLKEGSARIKAEMDRQLKAARAEHPCRGAS